MEIKNCYEGKEMFWDIWRRNKNLGLHSLDIERFDEIVRFFSVNFNEFDVFGKYQAFVAKILTRKHVKKSMSGAYLADIKNEDFAHTCCICEAMWVMGA